MALAAAVAVPAMAAPADWGGFDLLASEAQAQGPQLLGFETAGESFPGSAFYYLADEPYIPFPAHSANHSDAQPAPIAPLPAHQGETGPAANPLIARGSATDQSRALQCLTQAVYYEGASEPDAGQRAIAQVVLNRVSHPAYPNSVCGVVYQGSERKTGCQFTFTCDGALARKPSPAFWDRARRVAVAALAGAVYRPVGMATHYHTTAIHPYWADSLTRVGTIGAHHFYRWNGMAGQKGAFTSRYAGGEPMAAPRPRTPDAAADPLDPVALARRFEASLPVQPAQGQAAAGNTASMPVI